MPVLMDAPAPYWIGCDHPDCPNRTYVYARDETEALNRVAEKFGWEPRDGKVFCRTHRGGNQ